ncbi:MAG: hypothetical protein KJ804_02305 [Proteobacteria bacterium]|nr:hypothetical protein [Pseudomonadota bacterium]MBU1057136.1 hypothetical protein [Pseudomonadota bacterium]
MESIEEHSKYSWNKKHLKGVGKTQYDKTRLEILEEGSTLTVMLEKPEKSDGSKNTTLAIIGGDR